MVHRGSQKWYWTERTCFSFFTTQNVRSEVFVKLNLPPFINLYEDPMQSLILSYREEKVLPLIDFGFLDKYFENSNCQRNPLLIVRSSSFFDNPIPNLVGQLHLA